MQHEGEEFGYVLEGESSLKFRGIPTNWVKATVSISVPNGTHSIETSEKKARILWLNTPPTFVVEVGVRDLEPRSRSLTQGITYNLNARNVQKACP